MKNAEYSVAEAAKLAEVKSHVLRYWEDELQLPIHRNELGHRYYTGRDMQVFLSIRELKAKGLQLKEIRKLVSLFYEGQEPEPEAKKAKPKQKKKSKNAPPVKEPVIPEAFYQALEKLVEARMKEDSSGENHYKKLDAVIRERQQTRKLIAVTMEQDKQKKSGEKKRWFGKKK